MVEKFEIKIIRFKSGEDIVGFVCETGDIVEIKHPKVFYFTVDTEEYESELVMMDWMTSYAFAFQFATLPKSEILFITYPNLEFGYNYLKCILEELDPESKFYKQIKTLLTEQDNELESLNKIESTSNDVFPKILH
jgi:hypothetical protein